MTREERNAKMSAYASELYKFRKQNHICISCGNKPAEDGYVMCLACRMNNRERSLARYYAHRERYLKNQAKPGGQRDKAKELYKKRKAQGICVRCGKRKADAGKSHCRYCLAKKSARARERYKSARVNSPIRGVERCFFCSKPPIKGYKLCDEHLQRAKEQLTKASAIFKASGKEHPWSNLTRADLAKIRSKAKD